MKIVRDLKVHDTPAELFDALASMLPSNSRDGHTWIDIQTVGGVRMTFFAQTDSGVVNVEAAEAVSA